MKNVYDNGVIRIQMFEENQDVTMFLLKLTIPENEKSFLINKSMFEAMKSSAPKPMPSDGPENSAQQLHGKMPTSCLECPINGECVVCDYGYDTDSCKRLWRGLFRHFAV